MATKTKTIRWVDNPNYVEDKCGLCGCGKGEHFEVITPRGIVALCDAPRRYEDMPVGRYEEAR